MGRGPKKPLAKNCNTERSMSTTRKLLTLIREKYETRISVKTGWGKNELLAEYDKAVSEALMEMLDEPIGPITHHPGTLYFIDKDSIADPYCTSPFKNFGDQML